MKRVLLVAAIYLLAALNGKVHFVPEDLWIGIFWTILPVNRGRPDRVLKIYISFIPTLPIRLEWPLKEEE